MPRLPRYFAPGEPHHITQRGNRKMDVFLSDTDRRVYLKLLREQCTEHSVRVWAYCLMDNHVHAIMVPEREDSISRAFQFVHGVYAAYFNARHNKSGHLWQARFHSTVLDGFHLWNAVRYVERNPVRAGMVDRAEDFAWSSAMAHCGLRRDRVVSADLPLLRVIQDWSGWLEGQERPEVLRLIRERTQTGRPCASEEFTRALESQLGRTLLPQRRGRKKDERPAEENIPSLFENEFGD